MAKRTAYQRSHYPTKVLQVKCTNLELDEGDQCTACRRWLRRRVPHTPNITGSLGWIEYYADGTTYQTKPGERVSSPGH